MSPIPEYRGERNRAWSRIGVIVGERNGTWLNRGHPTYTNSDTFQFTRDQARCASADTDVHPSCNSNKKEPQTKIMTLHG
ncbi:hypothetical protein DPMN_026378 [Dreissena polymorpha]|uniref:Uncharacterized protein n=1 Tax=Dreissena polymorpha TaxID=45954 RepID=A0A9D4LRJ7_DREPO|nr:hypothetical protein DPMN_026378 [Dreissena polymorpha]